MEEIRDRKKDLGLYTITELSEIFKISRATIYDAINKKQLNCLNFSKRKTYIYLNDFINYMKKGTTAPCVENVWRLSQQNNKK